MHWLRVAGAVVRRPELWVTALRQMRATAQPAVVPPSTVSAGASRGVSSFSLDYPVCRPGPSRRTSRCGVVSAMVQAVEPARCDHGCVCLTAPRCGTSSHLDGDAGVFHQQPLPSPVEAELWWFVPRRPALVLGSGQPLSHVDVDACRSAGIDVVRRRSGGAAVLVDAENLLWVDVILPLGHPQWCSDVTRSGDWLGQSWVTALESLGCTGLSVHRAGMIHTRWSHQVCFAGVGGGEVIDEHGRKLVGISQRRTREGARFQCAVHRRWQPELLASLFSPPGPTAADLIDLVATVDVTRATLEKAFQAALGV